MTLFSQQEIAELQCELLVSSFRDASTIARVKENIGHISNGSSSHCAGALKLGLKKAFELKKKRKDQFVSGVMANGPVSGLMGGMKKLKGGRH